MLEHVNHNLTFWSFYTYRIVEGFCVFLLFQICEPYHV